MGTIYLHFAYLRNRQKWHNGQSMDNGFCSANGKLYKKQTDAYKCKKTEEKQGREEQHFRK